MRTYFIVYPRDFANEYTAFVVEPENRQRFARLVPTAQRITRKEATERGITRVREAKRTGEQWFGGLCSMSFVPATLDEAAVQTGLYLDELDAMGEAAR